MRREGEGENRVTTQMTTQFTIQMTTQFTIQMTTSDNQVRTKLVQLGEQKWEEKWEQQVPTGKKKAGKNGRK